LERLQQVAYAQFCQTGRLPLRLRNLCRRTLEHNRRPPATGGLLGEDRGWGAVCVEKRMWGALIRS